MKLQLHKNIFPNTYNIDDKHQYIYHSFYINGMPGYSIYKQHYQIHY